ncbi:hypothetical protein I79_015851 [Cricetulus griseus]|uniref:Uncharacterized protein n=1 Tax=Cricetulus griseus TaxID=10029 RepID=G3HXT7_CRIGR|nr:hypothetical protein I79_015851 [Cricetulus griseus]
MSKILESCQHLLAGGWLLWLPLWAPGLEHCGLAVCRANVTSEAWTHLTSPKPNMRST